MEEDDFSFDPAPVDPVVERADALIKLSVAVDHVRDRAAKSFLLEYMEKVVLSVNVSRPKADLILIQGGKSDD